MLPHRYTAVAELEGTWWVAHTKPRCEKALAFDLLIDGVAFYLPMSLKVIMSGGRKRKLMMPVFSSYVFVCGNETSRISALQTGRVVRTIPISDQSTFVEELGSIERALKVNGRLDLYPFAAVGRRCRVRTGPFVGIEGIVAHRDERSVLVLNVTMLGCGAALEIDMSLLEPVD